MVVVVSDTSPVRALAHLGSFEVVRELFDRVLVPPAVDEELRRPCPPLPAVDVRRFPFVDIRSPRDRHCVSRLARDLDPGEPEALAPALEVGARALLIDERAGRSTARQLGIPVVGTLGILLRSKERGLIPALRPLIARLEDELGFFLSPASRDEVLRRAGE